MGDQFKVKPAFKSSGIKIVETVTTPDVGILTTDPSLKIRIPALDPSGAVIFAFIFHFLLSC